MNPKDISEFLHQLADVQGAFESSVASLTNPRGNHDLAKQIQSKALERFKFVSSEFRNKFKETSSMKPTDLALLGLVTMASGNIHAESLPPKKVALILKASKNAFYDGIVFGAKDEATKYNYHIEPVYGSYEDDWQFEVSFLEKEADNYDAFILDPIRSDVFTKVLKMLKEKGKPVVIVDSPLTEGADSILATVSSDNFAGGKLAGLYIAGEIRLENPTNPCVIHFSGNAKAKGHQDRNEGFLTTLRSRIPNVKIQTFQGLSSFEQALKIATENLETISKCDAVFAGSDTMILGVLKAFEDKRMRPPAIMVGYDAILEAQKKILAGKITASVEQFPSKMGVQSVQALDQHFRGLEVRKEQLVLPQLSMRKLQVETYTEEDLESRQPRETTKKVGTKG